MNKIMSRHAQDLRLNQFVSPAYTEEMMIEALCYMIRKVNPRIKIGERLTDSTQNVWQGKIVHPLEYPKDSRLQVMGSSFGKMKKLERPYFTATCVTQTHRFEDDLSCWKEFQGEYLYPYKVFVPYRDLLLTKKPGDIVLGADPTTFDLVEYVLTEEVLNDHRYIQFRYASGF